MLSAEYNTERLFKNQVFTLYVIHYTDTMPRLLHIETCFFLDNSLYMNVKILCKNFFFAASLSSTLRKKTYLPKIYVFSSIYLSLLYNLWKHYKTSWIVQKLTFLSMNIYIFYMHTIYLNALAILGGEGSDWKFHF